MQTDHGLKPIEEIETGDEVLSYNEQTRLLEYREVTAKRTRYADDIYSVGVEGENKPLGVTSEHPFFVRVYRPGDSLFFDDGAGEWRETRELRIGDEIRLASGQWARVLNLTFKGAGQVYNFTVAGNHNYFVGDSRLLTHNAGCPNPYGTLGKPSTRQQIYDIGTELKNRGWDITGGGGRRSEEYLKGLGPGRKGSSLVDITATKDGRTLRINTIDTRVDGITPSTREANNAVRIRSQRPGEHLLLIPKP